MFPISFFPQLSSKCHAVDRRGDRRWNNHQLSRHSSLMISSSASLSAVGLAKED